MVEITSSRGVAEKCGIRAGDFIVNINGHEINDVLDYKFYADGSRLKIDVLRDNVSMTVTVVKDEYEDLGLDFATFLMDEKQSCRNNCVFCFVDQMPQGMRESLYFKDDDSRLSFLHGNYVTLTNLTERDIQRILKMKLSVNISVHTTNPELRVKMMKNKNAGEVLGIMRRFADGRIQMNAQIVLCPGWNCGEELRRTLADLGSLLPQLESIAVVPVGLTKHRQGLTELRGVSRDCALETLGIIGEFRADFRQKHGDALLYAADELFLKADLPVPPDDYYEAYPQYANGVGMLRSFEDDFFHALSDSSAVSAPLDFSIATGVSVYPLTVKLAAALEKKYAGVKCRVYAIRNDFFGESVTVTGLLTGQDLLAQLRGKELGEELLLSKYMFKADENILLDDMSADDLSRELGVKIHIGNILNKLI